MAKEEQIKDLTILGELDRKFAEAAALLPQKEVTDLALRVGTLRIENDQDQQAAADMGVTVAGWVTRMESFWEAWREHYYRRYKAILTVTKDGITTVDRNGNPLHVITGVAKLGDLRKEIEHAMRQYRIRREQETAKRQAAMDNVVSASKADIEVQMQDMLLQGDFDGARKLRFEASNLHPVAIMRQDAKLEGATERQPYKWSLDEGEESLMKVIRAIASGDVPLYSDVMVKGKLERRSLIELSSVVLNHRTREMGPQLNIPGITVTRDVSFAFAKKGA